LKQVLRKLLPRKIWTAARWDLACDWPLFRGQLQPFLRETLLAETSLNRGLFRPEAVKRLVEQHTRGERDHSPQLWTLLMLELWYQRFID